MTAVKRVRHFIEYVAFLVVAGVFGALPVEIASRWSGVGWRLIAPHSRRHQRALDNLAAAFPDKAPDEIQRMALAMWENLGRNFAEFFHLDEIARSDRIELQPPELVAALRGRQGAAFVCSLHMGNWELASQGPMRLGWRLASVYQAIHNPFVDHYVKVRRAPYFPGGLLRKSPAAARTLLRHVRDGGCTAVLADQRDSGGPPVAFFGRPAKSTAFPAFVGRTANAPIYALRVKRLTGVRFSIRLAEVPALRTGDRDADVAAVTASVQSELERMIREAPEQWMWAHRRWD